MVESDNEQEVKSKVDSEVEPLKTSHLNIGSNLSERTKKNTSYFSFDGMEFIAKCISVYDGDTVNVIFKVPGFKNNKREEYFKHRIRLYGIDTPEIKTKSAVEKESALKSRDFLRGLILNKYITIKCGPYDKYGRILGTILHSDVNINKLLIEKNCAVEYFGGTKKKFNDNKS